MVAGTRGSPIGGSPRCETTPSIFKSPRKSAKEETQSDIACTELRRSQLKKDCHHLAGEAAGSPT